MRSQPGEVSPYWFVIFADHHVDDVGVWSKIHRWTLSSHLWNAANSYDFFEAWTGKPSFVVCGFNFDHFLVNGRDDDLDDFSRFFLTMYIAFPVPDIRPVLTLVTAIVA